MSQILNEKEQKELTAKIERINLANKQIVEANSVLFAASQNKVNEEENLQAFYNRLQEKYGDGGQIQINLEDMSVTPVEEETKED